MSKQLTLLAVDDSNIIRSRIQRCKLDNIIVIGSAANGYEAIEEFKKHSPDIVTMDLTMPEMDGIDAIKNLIAIAPDTNILVISALSDMATALEAIKCGAKGFVTKPFTDQDLQEALLELMS